MTERLPEPYDELARLAGQIIVLRPTVTLDTNRRLLHLSFGGADDSASVEEIRDLNGFVKENDLILYFEDKAQVPPFSPVTGMRSPFYDILLAETNKERGRLNAPLLESQATLERHEPAFVQWFSECYPEEAARRLQPGQSQGGGPRR